MKTEEFLRKLQNAFLEFKASQEQKEWYNFKHSIPETDKPYEAWINEFIEDYL